MVKSTAKDAQDLIRTLWSAYSATPTNLKVAPLFPCLFLQNCVLFSNPTFGFPLDH